MLDSTVAFELHWVLPFEVHWVPPLELHWVLPFALHLLLHGVLLSVPRLVAPLCTALCAVRTACHGAYMQMCRSSMIYRKYVQVSTLTRKYELRLRI